MKRNLLIAALMCLSGWANSQAQPEWTRNVNTFPDSAYLFPVKLLMDLNHDVIVLSTYISGTGVNSKVMLRKFDNTGTTLWTYSFDNGGSGSPRGFDMVLDSVGNCYVAGGFMVSPYKSLLMKVSNSGILAWVNDSNTAQVNGSFSQLFIVKDKLYASASNGIAVFNTNGVEKWSVNTNVSRMTVDHYGQAIISGYSTGDNLVRYDTSGNINFSDSTIEARRMCVDNHNNILLLNDLVTYALVKYDSAGTLAWQKDSLPFAPPFGDGGFDVLADEFDNVILVGINDSIYKYSSAGNLKWIRTMNGLDAYTLSAKMYNGLLVVAGTKDVGGQYDMAAAIFNSYGFENWSGTYNSNTQQEFSVDLAMDYNGIYVIEDSVSSTTLIKFTYPYTGLEPVNYSLVCIDSVWYDPTNPIFINVSVFNGDLPHINYPRVMIIDPNGDTISNKYNLMNFFAHLGNTSQIYTDTILIQGITDFTGYNFVMSQGIGDTSVILQWCLTLSASDLEDESFYVYPNPFTEILNIRSDYIKEVKIQFFDSFGRLILSRELQPGENNFDVSTLSKGAYIIRINDSKSVRLLKM